MAAVNGPAAVVVSGDAEALDELLAALRGARRPGPPDPGGLRLALARRSRRSASELLDVLAPIVPQRVAGAVLLDGDRRVLVDSAELDAEYWYRNLRQPVRVRAAVRACSADGPRRCSSRSARTRC